ncbi:MAG TPA: ribonuclease H-like domain-containing protein [Candidatus Moranbacteria bacterium]|nr:ribonuclease H-like domain-containing protein [Candidatus Moranbacteria bacterium]
MSKIIVDIETIGFDFDSFDKKSQEYLLKFSETEEDKLETKNRLSLYPMSGEIVTIGMLNPDTMKGCVLFQNKGMKMEKKEENGIVFETGNEKEILEKFWERVKTYNQVITFNGRGFDGPFLVLRSSIHKIKTTKNLMGYRYNYREHCDLLDQLTFYGAIRKYNLDFYAKSFGIKSSKEEGVDGSMVGQMYKEGKYMEVAEYCLRDLLTTKEIFDYWDKYIRF